jgi:thiosulfate/3-mercaptopyruvate sulfurtransferase
MIRTTCRRVAFFLVLVTLASIGTSRQCWAQFSNPVSLSAASIPEAQQIQSAALIQMLQSREADRPLVLQVGSRVMFGQAHIPGSVYAGPASQTTGMQLLDTNVASVPKDKLIVIYCGCCPWNHCPNMGPAYTHLHELGFTNVKALYLARNFGDDWVAKGYPVEKGQ